MLRRIVWLTLVMCLAAAPLGGVLAAPAFDPATGEQGAADQASAPLTPQAWTPVASGIDFQIFTKTTPRNMQLFVTRMDRSNPNVTIETGIAQGSTLSGRETVASMAQRSEGAINYWGSAWGGRNQVAAAINGFYFDLGTGEPVSGVIHSGWQAHRYTPNVGDAGFAWTLDGQAFIGSCVYYISEKNDATFIPNGYNPNLNAVNVLRTGESFILYTPQFDSDTNTTPSNSDPVLELVVQLTRPALLISDPAYVQGFVSGIRENKGATPIPFDSVVLAFWGTVRDSVLSRINSGAIQIGTEVRLTQEVKDCDIVVTPAHPARPWTKTYAALGGDGDYHFLTDGDKKFDFSNSDAYVANSRTAVAFNANYVYFIVVDGFNPDSIGITVPELRDWVVTELGATDGVALDSGGSSTMVVNHAVINNTTCNFTRNCGVPAADGSNPSDALLPPDVSYGTDWTDETGLVEPVVGTNLMMVVSQPIQHSTAFTFTQEALITSTTDVRLGPGSNYASLAEVGPGSVGVVLDHFSPLDGVLATGDYWWFVDFNNATGWVSERALKNLTFVLLGNEVYLPAVSSSSVQTTAALHARQALLGEWPDSAPLVVPELSPEVLPPASPSNQPRTYPLLTPR